MIRKKDDKLMVLTEYRQRLEKLRTTLDKRVVETSAPNTDSLIEAMIHMRAAIWHLTSDESKISMNAFTFCSGESLFYLLHRIKASNPDNALRYAEMFYDLLIAEQSDTFDMVFPPEKAETDENPPILH